MQADIYNDLQDTGLLAYAESWGVIQDVNKLLKTEMDTKRAQLGMPQDLAMHDASHQQHGAWGHCQQDPMLQQHPNHHLVTSSMEDQPMPAQQGSSGGVDDATRQLNAAADEAAEAALAAVRHVRLVLQDVTTNRVARLAPMTSTTQQSERPAGRSSRKGSKAAAVGVVQPGNATANNGQNNKGLRQFALKVCEKVRERGRTTYNEVADLLVSELSQNCDMEGKEIPDDKTIRRRVYDAINVLMALDIIEREKKDIIWKGLPNMGGALGPLGQGADGTTGMPSAPQAAVAAADMPASAGPAGPSQNAELMQQLQHERLHRMSDMERKQAYLQELVEQHAALKQLISRNMSQQPQGGTEIHLPFILLQVPAFMQTLCELPHGLRTCLQARPDATVEVHVSEDMQDVMFDIYNSAIQIHDDSGIIKQMAMHANTVNKPGTPRSMQS